MFGSAAPNEIWQAPCTLGTFMDAQQWVVDSFVSNMFREGLPLFHSDVSDVGCRLNT